VRGICVKLFWIANQSKLCDMFFFAERSINKIAGVTRDTVSRKINSVAVIGAGAMGSVLRCRSANFFRPWRVKLIEVGKKST